MEMSSGLQGLSGSLLALVVVLGIIQLAVQVLALISLFRAKEVLFNNKWVWVVVIVLFGVVGSIIYFALGRRPGGGAAEGTPAGQAGAGAERARRAVDTLYGPEDKP